MMNTLPDADIFFFVSTVCFVVLAVLAVICLIILIRILYKLNKLTDKTLEHSESMIREINDFVHNIKMGLTGVLLFLKWFPKSLLGKGK